MPTLTKSQAKTASDQSSEDIVDAANLAFIDNADLQIQDAISQGRYFVNCFAQQNTNPSYIYQYYADLGYKVSFPDYDSKNIYDQPSNYFGDFWKNYWENPRVPENLKTPLRILISWE